MNLGQTVFAQLIEHLPTHVFRRCVRRYKGMTLFNLGGWIKNTHAYGFARNGTHRITPPGIP